MRENFLLWKTQLFPILNCNDLAQLLTQDPPAPTATSSADETIINPAYQAWKNQDQQVLSILVSSLSENVLPCVVGKTTSKEAWEALNKHYSSSNPSRIMYLHNKLHNTFKGTRSVAEYVQDIRRTCDELAAVEHPVQETVSVYALLRGLGSTYSAFNAGITSNLHNLTFEYVIAHINSHDELLNFVNPSKETVVSEFPLAANQTQLFAPDQGLTRRNCEVVDFKRYRVKNYSKLTNFRKFARIEGYNGKYGSNPQGIKDFLDVFFKFDQIGREIDGRNWGKWYFMKVDFKSIPQNQKSSNLDLISRRNQDSKWREIFGYENRDFS